MSPQTIQQYSLWSFYFLMKTMQIQFSEGVNNTHVCDKVFRVLGEHTLMLEEWKKHAK